jgi:putative oxidoreductase
MRYGIWLSRGFLALIFLLNGFGVIDQARAAQELSARVPGAPVAMLIIAGRVLQIAAGTALLLGWHERIAALALAAFLVPATLTAHDFWAHPGPEYQAQLGNFAKNVAMLGGLLLVACREPGNHRGEAEWDREEETR